MIQRLALLSVLLAVIIFAGCAGHVHTIGNGPQKNEYSEQRQWYALWGLVPINQVDTKAMAGTASNYEIKTETSALDVVINLFTTYVSVVSRTVTVTK
jgi:hypothetical protein